jgi:hypothetical protein
LPERRRIQNNPGIARAVPGFCFFAERRWKSRPGKDYAPFLSVITSQNAWMMPGNQKKMVRPMLIHRCSVGPTCKAAATGGKKMQRISFTIFMVREVVEQAHSNWRPITNLKLPWFRAEINPAGIPEIPSSYVIEITLDTTCNFSTLALPDTPATRSGFYSWNAT